MMKRGRVIGYGNLLVVLKRISNWRAIAALLIAYVTGIAVATAGDAVKWSAPGWYVIRWVQEDVAYDLMRGPFRTRATCGLALTKFKAQHKSDAHTIECRELAASPP